VATAGQPNAGSIHECKDPHVARRIVLTGGPGAGKTAVLELVRKHFCEHVHVLPESASILFGGGFPRGGSLSAKQAEQRAIFHVQVELERWIAEAGKAIVLCDRGTIDALAYWPGDPNLLWRDVHSSKAEQLGRYDSVIHLRTPSPEQGYNHQNALRVESAAQAAAIDARILEAWSGHPHRVIIDSSGDFLGKAKQALEAVKAELPACCRPSWSPGEPR
jgi:predicted ATPase